MSESWDWLIGQEAKIESSDDPDQYDKGVITAVRDDHPSDDKHSIRIVIDTGSRKIDTSKDRVTLS